MIPTFFGGGNFKSVEVNDARTSPSPDHAACGPRGALCYIDIVNQKVMAANPKGYGTDVAL